MAAKTEYQKATFGQFDILTSESPARTKKLVAEIMEVRRHLQSLMGDVPLPDPRIQIIVFNDEDDFREFVPESSGWEFAGNNISIGLFTGDDFGLTFVLVRGVTYLPSKEIGMMGYANYLLGSVVPKAPWWVKAGLPGYLSTATWRNGKIRVGGTARNHAEEFKGSKALPLKTLMNDSAVMEYLDFTRRNTVLYHDSWALWHQWLTPGDEKTHAGVRRFFRAMIEGEAGDADTLAKSFGLPLEEIESRHRKRGISGHWATVDHAIVNGKELNGLQLSPADRLDQSVAMGFLFARTNRGNAALHNQLLAVASTNDAAPGPYDALAVIALTRREDAEVQQYLERARARGSIQPFAYLHPVREDIRLRGFSLKLKAEVTEPWAAEMRALLQQCLKLDQGKAEACYYAAWVEAFAPNPSREIVEQLNRSGLKRLSPQTLLALAVANWRIGEKVEARALLESVIASKLPNRQLGNIAQTLLDNMNALERAPEGN